MSKIGQSLNIKSRIRRIKTSSSMEKFEDDKQLTWLSKSSCVNQEQQNAKNSVQKNNNLREKRLSFSRRQTLNVSKISTFRLNTGLKKKISTNHFGQENRMGDQLVKIKSNRFQEKRYNQNEMKEETYYGFNYDNFQGGNESKVVQIDARKSVVNPEDYPYSGIGKIVAEIPRKKRINLKNKRQTQQQYKSYGTASVLSPKVIMTSAHVLYFKDFDQKAKTVYFYPNPQISQRIKVESYFINEQFFNKQSNQFSRYDIAVLILEDNEILKQSQCLNIKWNYNLAKDSDRLINISGYPNDQLLDDNFMYEQEGKPSNQRDIFLDYKITTSGGNSGGPVLLKPSNLKTEKYEIIGVHKGTAGQHNYCLLLNDIKNTQQIFNELIQQAQLQQELKNIYQPTIKRLLEQNKRLKQQNQEFIEMKNNLQRSNIVIKQLQKNIQQLKYSLNNQKKLVLSLQVKNMTLSYLNEQQINKNIQLQKKLKELQQKHLLSQTKLKQQISKISLIQQNYTHEIGQLRQNIETLSINLLNSQKQIEGLKNKICHQRGIQTHMTISQNNSQNDIVNKQSQFAELVNQKFVSKWQYQLKDQNNNTNNDRQNIGSLNHYPRKGIFVSVLSTVQRLNRIQNNSPFTSNNPINKYDRSSTQTQGISKKVPENQLYTVHEKQQYKPNSKGLQQIKQLLGRKMKEEIITKQKLINELKQMVDGNKLNFQMLYWILKNKPFQLKSQYCQEVIKYFFGKEVVLIGQYITKQKFIQKTLQIIIFQDINELDKYDFDQEQKNIQIMTFRNQQLDKNNQDQNDEFEIKQILSQAEQSFYKPLGLSKLQIKAAQLKKRNIQRSLAWKNNKMQFQYPLIVDQLEFKKKNYQKQKLNNEKFQQSKGVPVQQQYQLDENDSDFWSCTLGYDGSQELEAISQCSNDDQHDDKQKKPQLSQLQRYYWQNRFITYL